jgi:hypothetical protein
MKRHSTYTFPLGQLLLASLCLALTGATSTAIPGVTLERIHLSSDALTRYGSSRSLVDLRAAAEALDGTIVPDTLTPDNFIATRRALVQASINVLQAVERSYVNPGFNPSDPKNIPFLCVPPPNVRGAYPCMSPSAVEDPTLRAAYVTAISINNEKIKRMADYHKIAHLDDFATATLDATLKFLNSLAPEGIGPDFAVLDGMAREAGLSDAKRNHIDAMIYNGSP